MNGIMRHFGLSAALSLALPLSGAIAQPAPAPSARAPAMPLEYAAKFVCTRGEVDTPTSSFAVGAYYTAVNIHNPSRLGVLTYKVALAPLAAPGPITAFRPTVELKYDQAFEVDCRVIAAMLAASGIIVPPVYSGFLVIQSRTELDVVAVYTAAPAPGKPVTAIHTERVPVRRVM
jgi:hypothetical protein